MSFTPLIFLLIYVALVGVFLILSILNFYHIVRFGFLRPASLVVTFVYLGLTAAIIFSTFGALQQVDWQRPIDINLPFVSTNEGSQ